jgi:hypothetical protein
MAEFDKVLIYRQMRDLGRRAEVGAGLTLVEAWALLSRQSKKKGKARGGKGLLADFQGLFPPASEREARMWMTPRSGVKTTPEMRSAFRGSRSQAGVPFFYFEVVCQVLPLFKVLPD